jgi:hypothetical protein
MQYKKAKQALRQKCRFRGDVENVLVNVHCSARIHSDSHIAALLRKHGYFFLNIFLKCV